MNFRQAAQRPAQAARLDIIHGRSTPRRHRPLHDARLSVSHRPGLLLAGGCCTLLHISSTLRTFIYEAFLSSSLAGTNGRHLPARFPRDAVGVHQPLPSLRHHVAHQIAPSSSRCVHSLRSSSSVLGDEADSFLWSRRDRHQADGRAGHPQDGEHAPSNGRPAEAAL